MKAIQLTALVAFALITPPASAQYHYQRWTYPKTARGSENATGATSDEEKPRLETKLEELAQKVAQLEAKNEIITVQPPEDPRAGKSGNEEPAPEYPTPETLRKELREGTTTAASFAGKWTTGATQEETARVDRIMEEMAQEFGFNLAELQKVWKPFPVYFVGQRGYAGCTYWEGNRVRCIEVVSLYDDKTDRVLRHELMHATLFYLVHNDASLFMHEATTQQSEPGVRAAYVSRVQAALTADKIFDASSWYDVNTYNGYGLKVYTYSFGVSEFLTSLGGKEWFFAFVLDYCRNDFESALRRFYDMSVDQFNEALLKFYQEDGARRDSLESLLEKKKQ